MGAVEPVQHHRRAARLLPALRRASRQDALGRQDARLRAQDEEDPEHAPGGPLHPRDPRRPRRRPLAERADRQARQGPDSRPRDGAPVAEADRQIADRRRGDRGLPRGPLRGPDRRHRERPAPGLRPRRARLRPGDARLPRARRRAARGDGRRAARAAGPQGQARARGRGARRGARADHRAPAGRPRGGLEAGDERGGQRRVRAGGRVPARRTWATRPRPRRRTGCRRRSGRGRSRAPSAARTKPGRTKFSRVVRRDSDGALVVRSPFSAAGEGDERPAGAVRRRHEPLRHDPAADDARRPSRPDDPAGDPLRPRPDQGRRKEPGRRPRTRWRR